MSEDSQVTASIGNWRKKLPLQPSITAYNRKKQALIDKSWL
ncbi:hypothetical protein [Proteus mirabilis]